MRCGVPSRSYSPSKVAPIFCATRIEAWFWGWITEIRCDMPNVPNARSRTACPISVAYPRFHTSGVIIQPTSTPGHPSGCHRPALPTMRPDCLSTTTELVHPRSSEVSDEDRDLPPSRCPVGGSTHVPVGLRVSDHRSMRVEVRFSPTAQLQPFREQLSHPARVPPMHRPDA